MRRLLKFAALFLAVAWINAGHPAVHAAAVDANGDIKSVDNSIYDAIATRDAVRLADLLDGDFTLTSTFGEVFDKQKFLSACCTGTSVTKNMSITASEMQVHTYGSAAFVSARTEMKFMKDNQNQQIV